MQTLTIDIIDSKALRLIHDLELLELIRVHKDESTEEPPTGTIASYYKGVMSKQPLEEIEQQLKELRSSWE